MTGFSLFRDLIDFCYPRSCLVCQKLCDAGSFCVECEERIYSLAREPACIHCAMPLPDSDAPCPHCFGDGLKPFVTVRRLSIFVDPVKQLIHQMKYHRDWNIGEHLADIMLEQSRIRELVEQAQVIVAIPLHPLRQISRGFNQAEVIAARLRKANRRAKIAHPAARLKHTETQTHLSRTSRVENLRDAFGLVSDKCIRDKRVLVVDDVTTTGSTLQFFGRCLKQAAPASLSAVTVAIADPKLRDFQAI